LYIQAPLEIHPMFSQSVWPSYLQNFGENKLVSETFRKKHKILGVWGNDSTIIRKVPQYTLGYEVMSPWFSFGVYCSQLPVDVGNKLAHIGCNGFLASQIHLLGRTDFNSPVKLRNELEVWKKNHLWTVWWIGTCFIFPKSWDDSIWRSPSFWVGQPPRIVQAGQIRSPRCSCFAWPSPRKRRGQRMWNCGC